MSSQDCAPQSYEELFDQYFDYVKSLVAKLGIRDVEDAAVDILVKFMQKDALDWYDPHKIHASGKTAKFKTMLRSFVNLYGLQNRDKQQRLDRHEALVDDSIILQISLAADPADIVSHKMDARVTLLESRQILSKISWGRSHTLCDVFDAATLVFEKFGVITALLVAEELEIGVQRAGAGLRMMRSILKARPA